MWKTRYKRKFKTNNPELIITAVRAFPNIQDTVEKAAIYYQTALNQQFPLRKEISSLLNIEHGCDFIPLYLSDTCPRLANLPFIDKGWFWCIGYQNKCQTFHNEYSRSITYPTHEKYMLLLNYYLSHKEETQMGEHHGEYLFTKAVNQFVYENTKGFTEFQNQKRSRVMNSDSLVCLSPNRDQSKTKESDYLPFIEKMYKRDMYEFMFNEYNNK